MSLDLPPELLERAKAHWPNALRFLAFQFEKGIERFVELQTLLLAAPESPDSPDFIVWRDYVVIAPAPEDVTCILLFGEPYIEHIFTSILAYKEKL